jgi:hypothetical protein
LRNQNVMINALNASSLRPTTPWRRRLLMTRFFSFWLTLRKIFLRTLSWENHSLSPKILRPRLSSQMRRLKLPWRQSTRSEMKISLSVFESPDCFSFLLTLRMSTLCTSTRSISSSLSLHKLSNPQKTPVLTGKRKLKSEIIG